MEKKRRSADLKETAKETDIDLKHEFQPVELQRIAAAVFGSDLAAKRWLATPHPSLNGDTPLGYANDEAKVQRVLGMLAGLRHGGVA